MNLRNLLLLLITAPFILLAGGCADKVGSPTGPGTTNTNEGMGRLVYNVGTIGVAGSGSVTLMDSNGNTIRNMMAMVPVVNESGVWSCGVGRFVWLAIDTTWPNGVNYVIVSNNTGTMNSIVFRGAGDSLVAFPVISPDGSHVAILTRGGTPSGSRRILVMALQSSGDSVIAVDPHFLSTSVPEEAIPCFSPDGSKIAYLDVSGKVIVAASDGSSSVPVATLSGSGVNTYTLWTIDWSTTNKLAFLDFSGNTVAVPIHVMNTDGTGMVTVDTGYTPSWSPDGKTLAYSNYSGDIVVTSDLGLTKNNLTNNGQYNAKPSWSPDGKQIAYTYKFSGQSSTSSIVSIDVATKVTKTLASSGFFASWLR